PMAWNIDTAHSYVEFSVKHMMVSTVKGRFNVFGGTFNLNETDHTASSIAFEIDAASISTGNEQRDGHLQSPDFLDVAQFPKITFV
ncbi:YceI family protein, partial [Klebsiella pneumoniae]|uniref:YceI family protein n=1 Tax=Klebsiella pneumoniae TaxID=573 RepID=UPI003853FB16